MVSAGLCEGLSTPSSLCGWVENNCLPDHGVRECADIYSLRWPRCERVWWLLLTSLVTVSESEMTSTHPDIYSGAEGFTEESQENQTCHVYINSANKCINKMMESFQVLHIPMTSQKPSPRAHSCLPTRPKVIHLPTWTMGVIACPTSTLRYWRPKSTSTLDTGSYGLYSSLHILPWETGA